MTPLKAGAWLNLAALAAVMGLLFFGLSGVTLGDAQKALGFRFIGRVYRENTFTSAIVDVAEGQRVIATGPYAAVRHPMYASALLYLLLPFLW